MEQLINGKKQVEVLSVDGEKYVIGTSLSKAAGIVPENSADWIRHQIARRKLILNEDWKDSDEGILFSFKAAARIFAQIDKPKIVKRGRPCSSYGYELDEYGLPILPPQKRRGVLINPYRI
jgi:hypothetical protein